MMSYDMFTYNAFGLAFERVLEFLQQDVEELVRLLEGYFDPESRHPLNQSLKLGLTRLGGLSALRSTEKI